MMFRTSGTTGKTLNNFDIHNKNALHLQRVFAVKNRQSLRLPIFIIREVCRHQSTEGLLNTHKALQD